MREWTTFYSRFTKKDGKGKKDRWYMGPFNKLSVENGRFSMLVKPMADELARVFVVCNIQSVV